MSAGLALLVIGLLVWFLLAPVPGIILACVGLFLLLFGGYRYHGGRGGVWY